ncbi:MAG: DEAD/DEAH box helicase [Thermodesulfobacteriota bacterium]
MTNEFDSIGLHPEMVQTLIEKGYTAPTPIQSELIPVMLAGRDVIGQSQTGSGKTAAYGLPILQALQTGQRHVQGLIVVPTRELAIQVSEAVGQYGRRVGVRVFAFYGGQPYNTQLSRLKKGVDVVVGTPGRLLDLIERKLLNLQRVSTVVLDEADEMLSMGFIADIEAILETTPADRQTALFSATMPKPILRLAERYLRDPHRFTMGRRKLTVATVEQRYYLINESDRLAALTRLFEFEPIVSALVFARTRTGTGELADELAGRGFQAEVLNGDLGQEARERVLQRFRDNRIKVLVATDVAARGLDIDHVSHVFNYDLPQDPEMYVHRIGRTGRAGKSGIAISLLTPRERWLLRRIEAFTRQKMTPANLPVEEDIQRRRDHLLVERMMVWLKRGRCQRERDVVAKLSEQGHDAAEIAAAALKLVRAGEKQRPIAPITALREDRPVRTRPAVKRRNQAKEKETGRTAPEKGMVSLVLSSGKADGLDVSRIVGSLSHHADIPGRCIGKIRIEDRASFVDVPREVVNQVLANKANYRIGRQRIDIARA